MLPYSKLIPVNKKADTAVYLQISNAFIKNIRRGILKSGLKLPSSRVLATLLHVNRNTINAALDELQAQGWIDIQPRKGIFVAQNLPVVKPTILSADQIQSRYASSTNYNIHPLKVSTPLATMAPPYFKLYIDDGFPDTRLAPLDLLAREIRRQAHLPAMRKYLTYGAPVGTGPLLEALVNVLSETRGLNVQPNNILITNGAQMGIYLVARTLLQEGDQVIVTEPNYFSANLTFQQAGAMLNRVPVDENGMDIDAVEMICKKKKIRLLYAVPHHHHPTTVTLSPERRMRLLELAAKYKFAIIEDDYDYEFHYTSNPILPMASLDNHGNVIYIGTLNKSLAPTIRVGFIVAPSNFIEIAAQMRRMIDFQGNALLENALAELYKNGTIMRHINKVQKIYHERRDHFCELLSTKLAGRVEFHVPNGGMSVWTHFPTRPLEKIAEHAMQMGLRIPNYRTYNTGKVDYNSIRMGFASLSLAEQDKAVDILAACVP
ncbi:GntR family transcriptional regulator/MocR family aminotransferase [Chitinophaga skermanii]|uniref:GntR family transcriptional regulator/MocR family aminotransferase n=1 Tax=Chitinophaga skermanii TaxID=331697 RepID=A0A327QCW6_9BACT|nr:PLP-dependent aminotransferase family protein [Chitinophaga skermanii]RAJ02399.1 GntR family transcriptional regulator/MocR family aminotransferase [Chitinophaga skermanii]